VAAIVLRDPSLNLVRIEEGDLAEAQGVFSQSAAYHRLMLGKAADPDMARRCFQHPAPRLPQGRVFKHFLAIAAPNAASEFWGIVDLYVGFPKYSIATIATWLIRENKQRQGVGSAALQAVEAFLRREHPAVSWLDVTLSDDNLPGLKFALRNGFSRTSSWERVSGPDRERLLIRLEKRFVTT